MEYYFTASYNGIEARLVFQSFALCKQARRVLREKGVTLSSVTTTMAGIYRSPDELAAAKKFVAFARS